MRINIYTGPNYAVPAVSGGGMSRSWHHLAIAFAQKGHEVTLLSRAYPGQPAEEQIDQVKVLRRGGFDQHSSTWMNLAHDFFDSAIRAPSIPEADIFVVNDFWLPALAPWINPKAGKVIISVNRMPKKQFFLYPRCHCFICPSEAVAETLEKQSPHLKEHILVIPNPYDHSTFHEGNQKRQHLLYVGRIHREKGVDVLIKAFRRIHLDYPDITLTIVGSSGPEQGGSGNSYQKELDALGQGLPIDWRGSVYDPTELASLYQSHSIFCYPSLADIGETFGIAPVEAMASGCVPVLSNLQVFKSYLETGTNGLAFDHHSPDPAETLFQKLELLISNPDLLKSMKARALTSAIPFNVDRVSEQYLECFEQAIP